MITYKRFILPADWNPLDTTRINIELLKDQAALVIEENKAIYDKACLEWQHAIQTAINIFGENSNVVRYMKKSNVPYSRNEFYPRDIDKAIEDAQKKIEAQEKEKIRLANEEALKQKQMRAVIWLQAKGMTLGQDFDLDNALSKANDMAFNEEIERRKKELKESGELLEFDGDDNCTGNCSGWDGESRRCECTARRVYWETGGDFEKPYAYGAVD